MFTTMNLNFFINYFQTILKLFFIELHEKCLSSGSKTFEIRITMWCYMSYCYKHVKHKRQVIHSMQFDDFLKAIEQLHGYKHVIKA